MAEPFPPPQAFIYRADTDALYGQLLHTELVWEDELNGVGAGRLTMPLEHAQQITWVDGADTIYPWTRQNLIRVVDGGTARFAFYVEEYEIHPPDEGTSDVTGKGTMVTLSGRGSGSLLEDAVVAEGSNVVPAETAPDGTLTKTDTTRQWTGTSRAGILHQLIGEAQDRGCFAGLDVTGWDGDEDSDAVSWTDADIVRLRPGSGLDRLVAEWADYGFDWRVGPDLSLSLWQAAGTDLSATSRLLPGTHLRPTAERGSLRDVRTVVYGESQTHAATASVDATAVAKYRRRESWQTFNEVPDASGFTAAALADLARPAVERSFELFPGVAGARPYVDFGLGDTLNVWQDAPAAGWKAMRVMAITGRSADGGPTRFEVTFDTLLEHRRRRWVNEQDRAPDGGGNGPGPGPDTTTYSADIYIPQQDVYWDWVAQGWPDGLGGTSSQVNGGTGPEVPITQLNGEPLPPSPVIVPPPGSVLQSTDLDLENGEGTRIALGACGTTQLPHVAGQPTVWHLEASGTSGSYEVLRAGNPIFTVNHGDDATDIQAAIDAWFGGAGGGTAAGDWDDWTWTLPGVYPSAVITIDDANLVGGTSDVNLTGTGNTEGRDALPNQFHCGIQVGGGTRTAPTDGAKITKTDGVQTGGDALVTVKHRLYDTGLDEDVVAAQLYRNPSTGLGGLRAGSPGYGVGTMVIDPDDKGKWKITNPDGTTLTPGTTTGEMWFDLSRTDGTADPHDYPPGHYVVADRTIHTIIVTLVIPTSVDWPVYIGDPDAWFGGGPTVTVPSSERFFVATGLSYVAPANSLVGVGWDFAADGELARVILRYTE